ncbi:MAG: cytochrome c biogenesis protein CcdA [Coriobacteriales bacterium]|nr:cytochrome c biogenesis protein CcdA [Coriobacteriales bacterium]
MNYLLTFLEGIVTFVSPCLLPLLPLYVAYFAGGASEESHAGVGHTVLCALGFVLGFSAVFVALGAFAGTAGSLLLRYGRAVDVVCGVVLMVLGLNYAGVLRIPALSRTLKPHKAVVPRGFGSSVLFGLVFAVGWSPCVGTFLASALSLAASSGSTLSGVLLLCCYSAGLGVPFVLSAVLLDRLEGAFAWTRCHYDAINRVCGIVLVCMGLLMATGFLGSWLALLSR